MHARPLLRGPSVVGPRTQLHATPAYGLPEWHRVFGHNLARLNALDTRVLPQLVGDLRNTESQLQVKHVDGYRLPAVLLDGEYHVIVERHFDRGEAERGTKRGRCNDESTYCTTGSIAP